MKKNTIEKLFEGLEGSFDVHETPNNHQKRFLEKLNKKQEPTVRKLNWWKPLSIAATIAVILAIGSMFMKTEAVETDLASVSAEMKQTQSFFTTTINDELAKLKSFEDPHSKELVTDALRQIEILESNYEGLKKDLAASGNDKRVIYAMISNFQSRIELLEQVIEKIEEIKILNTYRNETTI
ncbi:hypothetical protein [Ulvibacter antarcticus]|uniref:Uncharacterized protein n=1 Tax=Ulvibacter antarcticus TaxID=442714 RepID=A0A3L9YV30_9FLAO|nr:hypothetical protein [Ulvibacter antarcticus]RMA64174.1 hypothetical protein BXY75_1042 [Ulvibacter antarcticus]